MGRSQADAVYDLIRRDIIRCGFAPGQPVTKAQLVERYGFGEMPVRQALERLAQEGLVEPVARTGYVVASMTLNQISELLDLRQVLETTTVSRAAGKLTPADIDHLSSLCEVHYRVDDLASLDAYLEANSAFHVGIAAAAGNSMLAAVLDDVMQGLARYLYYSHQLIDVNHETDEQHRTLLDALVRGNVEQADRSIREEIASVRSSLLDGFIASSRLQPFVIRDA